MRRPFSRMTLALTLVSILLPFGTFAGTFYVDISGATQGHIDGDVVGPSGLQEIEAFEFHHYVSRQPGLPLPPDVHESIVFTKKRVESSTVPLLRAMDLVELLTVTFSFCDSTCQSFPYEINLIGAQIVAIEPWTRLDVNSELERIRLTYQSIEFVFTGNPDESVTLVP